jgi:hypothetical protein
MAFCNSCGSVIDAGIRFCPKCGKPTSAAGVAPQAVMPPPSPMAPAPVPQGQPVAATGGSNAVKIVLIVVAVIVGIGIIGAVTVGFVIHRAISRTHIESRDGNVRVHSPFGNVETSTDPEEAAKNLGVDVYPGSSVVKGSAANMTFGKAHTAAAQFETSASPDTVAQFYRSKYPSATFSSSEADHFTLIAGGKDNVTTITVEPEEGKTRISISRITGKSNE